MADSVPVVLITGQVPRAALGSDAFQEAPVFNLMSTCAKHAFLVTEPEELEATMRTAFEIARTGRPGPVVVDIPKDVQNWIGPYAGSGLLTLRGYDRRIREIQSSRIAPDHARAFFDLLKTSERPLIYAGGGVINSGAAGGVWNSRGEYPDGPGCHGQHGSAVAAHARHAWGGVRELRRGRLRFPVRRRIAVR
jgi:acetolactate synthase-1/2/3 large subunit